MPPIDMKTYHSGITDSVAQQAETDSPTAKGNAFCQWCLENIFDLTEDQAIDAREMSGGFDHSIDAVIDSDEKLIVVQAKYEEAHDWSEITKFYYDVDRIRNGKYRSGEANENAERIITKIREGYSKGHTIEYYYITSTTFTDNERAKIRTLDGYQTDIFFYDLHEIVKEQENKQNEDVPLGIAGKWFPLRSSTQTILSFGHSAVVALPLSEMHDFVQAGGNDLFASNVRQYLGRTRINKGIKDTIQTTPEKFWLYNNGITIVCEDFEIEGSTIKIQTPQIVNGCQTAKSIWEILSKKTDDERKGLGGAVLSRVIKGTDAEQKDLITRYTNTQNSIRGKDFFSLEKFHKRLQKEFNRFGYYYEIQRGSFASLKSSQRNKFAGNDSLSYLMTRRHNNIVPASEAIQAFAAAFKDIPAVAYARPNDLAPNGSYYDRVIEDSLEPEPRLFLYPYLVGEWAKSHGYSRGGEGGWRAHAALFYVHVYYVFTMELLKKVGRIDPLETHADKIDPHIWDSIFTNQELNENILETTDGILEMLFGDSKVVELVESDVRQFLRTHDLLSRSKPILSRMVEITISAPRNRRTIESFRQTMNAT